jgi:hypothetical protein
MFSYNWCIITLFLKALVFELCNLKPSAIKCPCGQWTSEAQMRFERFLESAESLQAKVTSQIRETVHIYLCSTFPHACKTFLTIPFNGLQKCAALLYSNSS